MRERGQDLLEVSGEISSSSKQTALAAREWSADFIENIGRW